MKKMIPLLLCLFFASLSWAQNVTIIEAAGWFESAYVEWSPVSGATSYNVYYSGAGVSEQKLDAPLIRKYGSYYRADALGLAPGSYTLKVVPVTNGVEGTGAVTSTVTVKAHDRSGFAFSNNKVPGAYNKDGTPKNGAVILYITENTKNTISLEVTGASANPCVGLQTILDGFKKGKENRPLIVRLIGSISDMSYMISGDVVIENSNNASGSITIEGVGEDAVANGWGIRLKNASNIEVRNLGIMNVNSGEGDNLGLQQNNEYVWIHHNDFFYGDAGSDSDQAKGDGALDCKKSTYVTFSYNHFWDTGKSNLLGLSEGTTEGLYITYHHNWYDHSDSRHPRVRFYSAHVYNNYYDGISKYGIGSTNGSSIFAEGNYFRNCKYPMLTSMQGSDVWDESKGANDYGEMPTFSSEDGGTIKAYDNYIEGAKRFVAYGDNKFSQSTVDFDAYVVTSKSTSVPSSVKSVYGSNTHNNFDQNTSIMYSYTAESPTSAKTTVMAYAGRMNGGDFKWTFNNAVDDTAYSVNTALKSALIKYTTSLIQVQGESESVITSSNSNESSSSNSNGSSSSQEPLSSSSSNSGSLINGDIVHNFTLDGTSSNHFNITGNLSTSKGTVTYGNLSLTQCLKMESSTQISFSIENAAELTLVFNPDFSGSVKINGSSYSSNNGIATISLESGDYTITKGESSNLFYISISFEKTTPIKRIVHLHNRVYFDSYANALYIPESVGITQINIVSVNGDHLKMKASGSVVDLNHLRSGVYIVRVKTDLGWIQNKIYKK